MLEQSKGNQIPLPSYIMSRSVILFDPIDPDDCIVCGEILGRKHKVKCSYCERFTHRLCGTGESKFYYASYTRDYSAWIIHGTVNLVVVTYGLTLMNSKNAFSHFDRNNVKPLS